MRDEIEARMWADNHKHMSDGLDRLVSLIAVAFDRLVAHLYDAPWERPRLRRPRG